MNRLITVRALLIAAGLILLSLSGCSTSASLWQVKSDNLLHSLRSDDAPFILPAEFANLEETYSRGELLLLDDEVEEADLLFRLAFLKGEVLQENLSAEKSRQAEAKRLLREKEERNEQARLEAIAREEKRRRREAAEVLARIAEQARMRQESNAEVSLKAERQKAQKERPLVTNHTVKRGETLPQIAALAEVYNDQFLWPILYRANRDQIRDPRHLWPGQVLRIPRNLTRDDVQEARRYAQDKHL